MKYAPQILGAVAVVTIAGAVSGATIGESPMLQRGHADTMPQAQMVTTANADMQATRRPPDHYPLKTPDGTIEVAELALHGRLRDRGGDMWWEGRDTDRANLHAEYDFYDTASPERIAHEERLLAFHGERTRDHQSGTVESPNEQPQTQLTRAEAPMALAEPVEVAAAAPAPAATIGHAKTVDVSAILAARK